MHTLNASFVLGFHGCDAKVARRLIAGDVFKPSQNNYDWLGHGTYFWEANPARGLEYARELKALKRGPAVGVPAVVGAVIDLGLCLDLTTSAGLQQVQSAHRELKKVAAEAGWPLPQNRDDLRRNLDCAVIRYLHEIRAAANQPPIDSVKGIFVEGSPIYPGSGFYDKTHVQICVCNPDCIKGVFRVPARYLA